MMKKKLLTFSLVFMMAFGMLSTNALAFQPAAHYVLIEKVTENLPAGSLIKEALAKYPNIAIWGANGPDIAFTNFRKMFGGISIVGDSYHRYRVGTYAKEQLQQALKSKDLRQIAFAAGWVTHITGDMECHGILVNPEAGVCFAEGADNDLHKAIESSVEPYAWSVIGGHDLNEYSSNKFPHYFASVNDIPYDLLLNATHKIYDFSLSESEMKLYATTYITGMSTGIGYSYKDYNEAINFLGENNRRETLEQIMKDATAWSVDLLTSAENGNYSNFSDAWNIDVGLTDRPISSFAVVIKTMDKLWAGTDDDIIFGIKTKSGVSEEWLLDKPVYNDFERGDLDDYHVWLKDGSIKPSDISSIYIRKEPTGKPGPDWDCEFVQVELNGKVVFKEVLNKEFTKKNYYWEKNVSFTD